METKNEKGITQSVSTCHFQGLVFLALLESSDPQKHMSMGAFRLEHVFSVL